MDAIATWQARAREETRAQQYETAVVTGPTGDRDTSGFYCELRPKLAQIPKWDAQFPKWDASFPDDVGRVAPE